MAKKKSSKKRSRGRRRIGAALNPSSPIVKLIAAGAGFAFATPINAQIDKIAAGKVSDKVLGLGQTGLGTLLLMSKGGGKMAILKVAAGGLVAGSGLKRALSAYGIIKPAAIVPPPSGTTTAGIGYGGNVGRIGNGVSRVGKSVAGLQGSQLLN